MRYQFINLEIFTVLGVIYVSRFSNTLYTVHQEFAIPFWNILIMKGNKKWHFYVWLIPSEALTVSVLGNISNPDHQYHQNNNIPGMERCFRPCPSSGIRKCFPRQETSCSLPASMIWTGRGWPVMYFTVMKFSIGTQDWMILKI